MNKFEWINEKKPRVLAEGAYSGKIEVAKIGQAKSGGDIITLTVRVAETGEITIISYSVSSYGGQRAFCEAFEFVTEADAENEFKCLEGLQIEFTVKKNGDYMRYKVEKVYTNRSDTHEDEIPKYPSQIEDEGGSGIDDEDLPF